MTNLLFIDNRLSIVEKVREAGFEAIHGDYFDEALKIPRHVLCTASNRSFTYGGGLDRHFLENFPLYCSEKQKRTGTNERIGNICFVISVNGNLQANDDLVREALTFARDNTFEGETLCLSGIGTGIGFLNETRFIEILQEVFN